MQRAERAETRKEQAKGRRMTKARSGARGNWPVPQWAAGLLVGSFTSTPSELSSAGFELIISKAGKQAANTQPALRNSRRTLTLSESSLRRGHNSSLTPPVQKAPAFYPPSSPPSPHPPKSSSPPPPLHRQREIRGHASLYRARFGCCLVGGWHVSEVKEKKDKGRRGRRTTLRSNTRTGRKGKCPRRVGPPSKRGA